MIKARSDDWFFHSVVRLFSYSVIALCLVGCDRGGEPSPAVATNVVEVTRTLAVTNVVTVTNVVVEQAERILSARRTAPYVVSSATLDEARLRRLLSESGARVIDCSAGSVALVEASDRALGVLKAVASVKALSPEEKIAPEAGERVCVIPLSSIDVAAIVKAVRTLGGEVVQEVSVGQPRIRARLSYAAVRKLAVRGDVRRIERDGE